MDLAEALQTLAPRLIAYGVARTGSLPNAEDVVSDRDLTARFSQLGLQAVGIEHVDSGALKTH